MATSVTILSHLSPRLIVVPAPETEITAQEVVNFCRDWEDDAGMSYPPLLSAAGKEELGGGVLVGITATLQNAQIYFEARSTPRIPTGTCTTADSKGEVLIASASTFITDGVIRGDTVFNSTDLSMATVLTVDSETQLTMMPLTGGSLNTWSVSDGLRVFNNEQCDISGGNVVAVDENDLELSSVLQSPLTQVVRTSSSSATLQELQDIQYASYAGGVWYDVNGTAGTTYPTGTERQPVNNFVDGLSIAGERGFNTFYIRGDATIDAGLDFTDYVFIGQGENLSLLTISASADVLNCTFAQATVQGTLDGESRIEDCSLLSLNFVSGVIKRCTLNEDTITLAGSAEAQFINCQSGVAGATTPVINCGGSGQPLVMNNYNGGITLMNKTGVDAASINLTSGQIILLSSVTNGSIVCRGTGTLTDNSAGATVVDELVSVDAIAAENTAVLLGTASYP